MILRMKDTKKTKKRKKLRKKISRKNKKTLMTRSIPCTVSKGARVASVGITTTTSSYASK